MSRQSADGELMEAVTCIMPTADRRQFVAAAIQVFLKGTTRTENWRSSATGTTKSRTLFRAISKSRTSLRRSARGWGNKRNLACEAALGDINVCWDDDDWHASWRLRYRVNVLERGNSDISTPKSLVDSIRDGQSCRCRAGDNRVFEVSVYIWLKCIP